MIWSNESWFQLFQSDGWVWVWDRPQEDMDPKCQQGTMQDGEGSVMVQGVCTWYGQDPLVYLTMSLTSNNYTDLLGDHLQTFMDFTPPPPTMIGYSSRIMNHTTGPKLSRTGLRSILESLHNCCSHLIHQI